MLHQMRGLGWAIAQGSSVVIGLAIGLMDGAVAQIVPDETLGAEGSRVTPNVQVKGRAADRIDGGAVRGANLFHSFQEFNVGNGQRVYFANPTDVRNILTRVTGNNLSNIQGTLGVDGGANLFLMNPNGIVFGQNARLDVAGSFVGTTANAIGFGNQGFFSATPTATVPLLSINPSALFFNQVNTGSITGRSRLGLSVPSGQTLALIGGTLILSGSVLNVGGEIELAAIDAGMVNFDSNLSLNIPNATARADIAIDDSTIDASAGAGGITINADNIIVSGRSRLTTGTAKEQRTANSQAGDIELNATSHVRLTEQSRINNEVGVGGVGTGGDIRVTADSLEVTRGAKFMVLTFGQGDTGDIVINVRDQVSFDGYILDVNSPGGSDASGTVSYVDGNAQGQGGDIQINANSVSATNGASIATFSYGQGKAGNIRVNAIGSVNFSGAISDLEGRSSSALSFVFGNAQGGDIEIGANSIALTNGAEILAFTFGNNNTGQITLNARDRIVIDGVNANRQAPSIIRSQVNGGRGQSGDVRLSANSIAVTNGGQVNTSSNGQGNAGSIILTGDRVSVEGASQIRNLSGQPIRSEVVAGVLPSGRGDGGDVRVTAGSLFIRAGGRLDATTEGNGKAGNIIIESRDRVILDGFSVPGVHGEDVNPSGISSVVTGEGRGGNIQIATDVLSVTNSAELITGTIGRGEVGDVILDARLISFDSSVATSSVFPGGQGRGGNIRVRADSMSLTNGALLFANTFAQGNAGNISIHANRILIDGSNGKTFSAILANAEEPSVGRGGAVQITALDSLIISNGARIATDTKGNGDAGDITINAPNGNVLFTGRGRSSFTGLFAGTLATGRGTGGSIIINANHLRIENGATVNTLTRNRNPGGAVRINSNTLEVIQGGQITTNTTSSGRAGDITLEIQGQATFVGSDPIALNFTGVSDSNREYLTDRSAASGLFANTLSRSTGEGGNISLSASQLVLEQGAQFTAASQGDGDSGNVVLAAQEGRFDNAQILAETVSSRGGNISLRNFNHLRLQNSGISASTRRGQGGDVQMQVSDTLTLSHGSQITASTQEGRGGNIDLNRDRSPTNSVELTGNSTISAQATGSGNAGNVTLRSREIGVREQSRISAATTSGQGGNIILSELNHLRVNNGDISASTEIGQAGSMTVSAAESVNLSGAGAGLSVQASNGGTAGTLKINTEQLTLANGAQATVSSNGSGTAGNLDVTARNVQLRDRARLTAETVAAKSGGNINLQISGSLQIDNNSEISASTETGQGGSVSLNRHTHAAHTVDLTGNSQIAAQATGTTGNAGSLNLNADRLNLQESQVTVSSQGTGTAGNLTVTVPEINLNRSRLTANTASGSGGNVELRSVDRLNLRNNSEISATTQDGKGGRLSVNANQRPADTLQVNSGSNITTEATGRGDAGRLNLNTQELTVQGSSPAANSNSSRNRADDRPTPSSISAASRSGTGGSIQVNADRITVRDRGRIAASTRIGQAGDLTVNADSSVRLSDRANLSVAATGDGGRAGNLSVNTRELVVSDNSAIAASNASSRSARNRPSGNITLRGLEALQLNDSQITSSTQIGQAGSLNINAADGSVALNNGRVLVQASGENGRAGGLTVTSDRFTADNGSSTSVSSRAGRAGTLEINANAISLDNSRLTAEAGSDSGAEINLRELDQLYLKNGSQISARAFNQANGGNVAIEAANGFVIAQIGPNQNNDIIANASEGRGGNIEITTQGIFGIQEREQSPATNDINASSQFGLNGNIDINQLNADPSRGLIELPTAPIDATNQIAAACPTNAQEADRFGSFIVSGRGGLPPNPIDLLSEDNILTEWVTPNPQASHTVTEPPASTPKAAIVEAQGWVVNAQGKVTLVAQPASEAIAPAPCQQR